MTARLSVDVGLDLAPLPASHKLRTLLGAVLAAPPREGAPVSHAHWPAAHLGLDRVPTFLRASEAQRGEILDHIGRGLLEEAYFIEKAGMAFAAKMALLAESTDERMLYALFAADETRHFDSLRPFLAGPPPHGAGHPFLALLADTIATGTRPVLQFVVQIVLEGWGLSHYRWLRDGCTTPALRTVLDAILADEAAHHGSGMVLFHEAPPDAATVEAIVLVLVPFLRMVQSGPQLAASAITSVLGEGTRDQRVRLFEELDATAHAHARLTKLRALMRGDSARAIALRLDAQGAFRPFSPEECA